MVGARTIDLSGLVAHRAEAVKTASGKFMTVIHFKASVCNTAEDTIV